MLKAISRLSIRTKILSSSIFALLLVCAFIFSFYLNAEKKEINHDMQNNYHDMAEMIAFWVGTELHSSNVEIMTQVAKWAKDKPDIVSIVALDTNQREMGKYHPSNTELTNLVLLEHNDTFEYQGKLLHIAKVPITYQNTKYGTIILTTSLESYDKKISEKSNTTLIISFSILLMGILLSLFLSRAITKPLIILEQAAKKISRGNYDLHVDVRFEDEIGILGRSFNEMAKEINLLFSRLEKEIEESKRMEKTLEEKEKRYRELFDFAPIGYHELDTQGRIIAVNRTELDMLGYTNEEMIGQFVWKFVGDSDSSQQRVLNKLNGVILPTKGEERVFLRKDGSTIQVLIEENILRDTTNYIIGIRTTLEDITERKRLEQERESIMFELQNALSNVKTLSGLIPICASCKKIRNDQGFWNQLESYIMEHSDATFSHGICPDCIQKLYPDAYERLKNKEKVQA